MNKQRIIRYIVIHCTATQPETPVESIQRYWRENKKWGNTPGYHYLIKNNGEVVQLLDEFKPSYGVLGHNHECVNLCYIGGIDRNGKPKDTRSVAQIRAMYAKIQELKHRYANAEVRGRRDFPEARKACPSFDVRFWLANYKAV